jgi:uncharacterized C2H2 Zn-finger protein
MANESRPKIIFGESSPRIKCPVCGELLVIPDIDRRIGKIPLHQRPDEAELKCPASGKLIKREYLVNP